MKAKVFIMMKRIVIGLTLFILLTIADIVETSDSFDSSAFLPASEGDLPDNTDNTDNLFTDFNEEEQPVSLFTGDLASAQDECTSNGDVDNLFLSSGIARIRPRGRDECLPPVPLAPYTDIYDSNGILNFLGPQTLPRPPDITIPDTERNTELERLEEMLTLPEFIRGTNPGDQDDVCPKELVGESQIPVCDSGRTGRDFLRLAGEDHYTLYNVRYCMSPRVLNCLLRGIFIN